MESLLERYADRIDGCLECLDRVIIMGTLPGICYADGMTRFLRARGIRIFDYPRFAQPLRQLIRDNAEDLARHHGLEIEFIRKKSFRQGDRIRDILKARGDHPGLVTSSRSWSRVTPTSPGITRVPTRPI